MKKLVLIFAVIFFCSWKSRAQESKDPIEVLSRCASSAIIGGFDFKICEKFETSLFSIVVSFSDSASVSKVNFSTNPNCFTIVSEAISRRLKSRIESQLRLNPELKPLLANKYVIFLNYYLGTKTDYDERMNGELKPLENFIQQRRNEGNYETIPRDWSSMLNGINFSEFQGQDLAFIIPVYTWFIDRAHR